jgi:hypothetical protein
MKPTIEKVESNTHDSVETHPRYGQWSNTVREAIDRAMAEE